MKNLIIFTALIAVFYIIDKQLNIEFIEVETLERSCQYSQQKIINIWNIVFLFRTLMKQIFYYNYSMPIDIKQNLKINYQQFETCRYLNYSNSLQRR
ncbi:unnamed protein product [Paramecium sonneborni]|uniref:Uncharacterized protein n=1 Tax=Paramecium sonneborni TaxID=65129 RepID=A0A8S1M566_9CILI|nr:unnamed protein product [Paramecium sonneborni]